MSHQITTAFVDQFKANILLLSQQKESKLRQICRMEDVTGDTMYVERIGATEAQDMGARHGDTPQIDTPHSRRKLSMSDKNWADLIPVSFSTSRKPICCCVSARAAGA